MKMHIDTDVCTGHGACEGIGPDIFEIGDEGSVHLVTEVDRQDLEDGVCQCPTQARRLEGGALFDDSRHHVFERAV
jgi:ferredoxin